MTRIDDAVEFLDRLFSRLAESGIDVTAFALDHLCYRVATWDEYAQKKAEFLARGELLTETPVNGRPIATFKLREPVRYRGRVIDCVELPAPKTGAAYVTGYEHAEFVIPMGFDEFQRLNPGVHFDLSGAHKSVNPELTIKLKDVTVKFHHVSLERVIAQEKSDEKRRF